MSDIKLKFEETNQDVNATLSEADADMQTDVEETTVEFAPSFEETNAFQTAVEESEETFSAAFGETTTIGGVGDYESLINKPQIEGVTLLGNKAFTDLGLTEEKNTAIDKVFYQYFTDVV